MFVATLISAPGGAGLSPASLREATRLLTGETADMRWLHRDRACDIFLAARPTPDLAEQLAELCASEGVDCVVQEQAGRRKRFLIADMDSTMIEQECIDELAAEIGIKDRVAAITARAMNGEIAFEPALRERVALLKELPEDTIGRILDERITLAPGGRALVATMRASGAYTALVSGGFTAFTGPIAARLGFDEHRANRLIASGGRLVGMVEEPILGSAAKVDALRGISAKLGITPADAIAVGDGANDLPMIQEAGTGIALHAKPAVAARAPHRIDHGDLSALLFVQGFAFDDFVR